MESRRCVELGAGYLPRTTHVRTHGDLSEQLDVGMQRMTTYPRGVSCFLYKGARVRVLSPWGGRRHTPSLLFSFSPVRDLPPCRGAGATLKASLLSGVMADDGFQSPDIIQTTMGRSLGYYSRGWLSSSTLAFSGQMAGTRFVSVFCSLVSSVVGFSVSVDHSHVGSRSLLSRLRQRFTTVSLLFRFCNPTLATFRAFQLLMVLSTQTYKFKTNKRPCFYEVRCLSALRFPRLNPIIHVFWAAKQKPSRSRIILEAASTIMQGYLRLNAQPL